MDTANTALTTTKIVIDSPATVDLIQSFYREARERRKEIGYASSLNAFVDDILADFMVKTRKAWDRSEEYSDNNRTMSKALKGEPMSSKERAKLELVLLSAAKLGIRLPAAVIPVAPAKQ